MLYSFTNDFFTFTYNSEFSDFFLKSSSYSFDDTELLLKNKLSSSFWQCVVKLMWFFYISCSSSFSDTLPSLFLSILSKKYTSSSLLISGLIFFSSLENYLKVKSWFVSKPKVANNFFKSMFCSLILNLKSDIILFSLFSNYSFFYENYLKWPEKISCKKSSSHEILLSSSFYKQRPINFFELYLREGISL
jgi:hypothetical protein